MSTFAAPDSQHMRALARANATRLERAALKERIRSGQESASAVVLDPPVCAHTMYVVDLLRQIPRVAEFTARQIMREAQVSPRAVLGDGLGGLTARQRRELVRALGAKGWARS